MWTMAVHKRLITPDRQGHRRSAHVTRDAKTTTLAGVRHPRNAARHAADRRVRIAGALATRRALVEMPQRVIRTIPEFRIFELIVAILAERRALRRWFVRRPRTRAIRVGLVTCLVSLGFAGAAAPLRPTDGPAMDGIGVTTAASLHTGSGSDSRPTSGQKQLNDAAPRSDVHSGIPDNSGPHRTLDSHVAPDDPGTGRPVESQVVPDDPELEQALTDLDKQADLELLPRQQPGTDPPPPLPAANAPATVSPTTGSAGHGA
jgi:hypothetical protein